MTENEAKQWLKHTRAYQHKCDNCEYIDIKGACNEECKDFYDMAIQALEEIEQYRAIVTVEQLEWCKDASHWKELFKDASHWKELFKEKLEQYEAIGTVEEVRMLKDYKELYDVYKLIGTIEEFRNLKYKKNVLPIATIEFSKEDMQKMVDEKVAQIELDIQGIRAKAIDEFARQLKESLNQEFPSNYESTKPFFALENARLIVDDVAEQMKAGGKE